MIKDYILIYRARVKFGDRKYSTVRPKRVGTSSTLILT